MKNFVRIFLQLFVWIWQLPQIVICCLWCIIARPRYLYSHHNVLLFTCNFAGGVSFGPMAFYSERHRNLLLSKDRRVMPYLNHEYGHSMDSRLFGPLYLLVIGIPSGVHLWVREWLKSRFQRLENYYAFYPERRANRNSGVDVVQTKSGSYILRMTDMTKIK